MAREELPELVETPAWEPLKLRRGQRVARYFGEFGAQVVGGDRGPVAVDSTLPLRSDVGGGPKRLVDLALEERGGALVARNPLVSTRIPERPMDGIELGDDGFAVGLESPSSAEAELVKGRAFAANALTDTDLVVLPTPRGAQISLQVRSVDAPEQATLPIRLPQGASLRLVEDEPSASRERPRAGEGPPDGSVEVVRRDEVLAAIQPPAAWDADGQPLEGVGYEVDGSKLVVRFPHRSTDVLYPLAVDPQVDRFRINATGQPIGNGSYVIGNGAEAAAWNYNRFGYGAENFGVYPGIAGYTYEHNNVLALSSAGYRGYANNSLIQWYWQAPRQSWIFRADYVNVDFIPTYQPYPLAMCVLEGVFSATRGTWESGNIYEPTNQSGGSRYFGQSPWVGGPWPGGSCSPQANNSKSHLLTSVSPGNIAAYRLLAYGDGARTNGSYTEMDGAAIHLDDAQAPSITSASSSPGGWVRSATITTTVNARDAAPGTPAGRGGLGMFVSVLSPPTEGGGAQINRFAACQIRLSRCPEAQTFSYSYSTESDLNPDAAGVQRVREGANPVIGTAYDSTGKPTAFTAGTLRVDRSGPSATLGGIESGQLLRDRDYEVAATATDALSGARKVQIKLDGTVKAQRTDCAPTSAPCRLGWTLDGSDPALTEGTHTIEVAAKDQVDNDAPVVKRSFRVERTGPTIDVEGSSLMPEGTVWVARGEQDVLFDASDEGTGVVGAQLRIDGELIEAVDQDCAAGGCELSHDFYTATDALSEGEHTVVASATDGAGNTGRREQTIRLERRNPSLSLSGSLRAAEGQTLTAGQTYELTAGAGDASGPATQSGMGALEFAVDGSEIEIFEQPCESGGCEMSRSFEYVVDDYGQGPHTISVTATDIAGNEVVQSVEVGNPDPPPPSCGPLSPAPPGGLPVGLPRDLAEQLFRGALPAAFEPSSTATFLDYALKPGLDAARPDEFRATGTLAGATFDRDAADGVTTEVQTDEEPSCLTPTDVAAGASAPRLAGGAAALYANSRQSTDTIVRPSATGAFNLTQVRDATAPGALSWSVALQPGQQLAELPGGAVAVIEPAEEGTSPPETIDGLPAPPSPAEQRRALNDTELQLRLASDALERAQGENPDRVIGLMPPPWAKDKLGRAVATSLSASGSTITMQIAHSALTPYPVVAGQEYVSRDSVDEYETLSALASVGDYAWEENSEPGPEPASAQRTAQAAAAAPGCDGVDDEVEPIAGQSADLPDDIPDVEDEGVGAVASAKAKRINRGNLKALKIGITAADPATIVNPDYSDQPGVPAQPNPLDPDFVRPFARWNLMTKADNPDNRNNSTQWRCWADQADGPQRRVRGDVAITHDARLGQGGTKNFTARGYRIALKKFLARYGGPDGVVDNLMAWNEPQYEGTGRKDGKGRPNKGSPLKRKPLLAARVWAQAMRACFPSSGPLCGHYTAGGQFEAGRVVAGDFAGMKRDKALRQRGSKRSYTVHYFNEIKRAAAKLTRGGYRRKLPRVWSFHNYGDYKIFALRGGRAARKMTITRRYMRAYRSDDYEFFGTGKRRKPAIWLTEVGHNYHVNCASLQKPRDRAKFCRSEDAKRRVSLFGMRRQAKTMGFMLKAITNDFYPQIRRIYYFNLRTRRSCGAPRLGDFTCPLSEFGLLGAEDDDVYRSKLPGGGPFLSVKGGSDKANYSSNGARRFSFCLVRDRAVAANDRGARWTNKPGRINRTNCPADPQ